MNRKRSAVPEVRLRLLRPLILALAAVAVYAGSLSAPFIFDDRPAIADNAELRQWPDLMRVLRSAPPETPLAGRPAVSLTFGLTYAVSGADVRGFRVGNLALHIVCGLLLFAVARRLVAEPVAFAIALIWIVHPLNSEVVSYLSQRTDSAMAACLLLTLLASMRARESSRPLVWQAVAVAAAAIGMACKESMVVAPVLVVLVDRIFVFGSLGEAFRARRRFYGAVALSWIVLFIIVTSTPRTFGAGFASTDPSVWHYLLNQSVIITRYLWLTVWPRDLVLFYGWSMPTSLSAVWPYVAWIATLVGLTMAALWRKPALGFLGAWFFITLAPTSSLAPIVGEVGAERRMYLALAAVVAVAVLGVVWCWQRVAANWSADVSRARSSVAGAAALSLVVTLLGVGTILRAREYASALTMARTNYERWPSGAGAAMLGRELIAAGQRSEAMKYLRDSALTYPPGRYALACLLIDEGAYDAAITELRAFIRAEPNLDMTRRAELLLGEALTNVGVSLASTGRADEAITAFREVVAAQPTNAHARLNLARALLDRGRDSDLDEAQHMATTGAGALSSDAGALELVGRALERRGDRAGARAAYERALALDYRHIPAAEGLARIR